MYNNIRVQPRKVSNPPYLWESAFTMKYSIKKFLLESMHDWDEDFNHITEDTVGSVGNVSFDKGKDSITIDFSTTFGSTASISTSYAQFKKWFSDSFDGEKSPYKKFIQDFLRVSDEQKEDLEEIIDDDGNIIGDDDMPPNTTNSMVGTSNQDTDQVANSSIPKSIRMYSGDLGVGIVTW